MHGVMGCNRRGALGVFGDKNPKDKGKVFN